MTTFATDDNVDDDAGDDTSSTTSDEGDAVSSTTSDKGNNCNRDNKTSAH